MQEVEFQFANGQIMIKKMPDECWQGREYIVIARSDRPEDGNARFMRIQTFADEMRPVFREIQ